MRKFLLGLFGILFVAAAHAADLPAGYTPLEYITSDGEQYINTGITMRGTYQIETKFMMPSVEGNFNIFGASNGTAYDKGEVALWWNRGVFEFVKPTSNSASDVVTPKPTALANTIYTVTANKNYLIVNDNTQAMNWYASYVGQRPISIFATNRTSGYSGISTILMYYFKIWDENGTLVRNMVPAQRNTDGAIGMYDLADPNPATAFYTNNGTGDFIAGPEL